MSTKLTSEERIELLEEAREQLQEAIDKIEEAVYETRLEDRAEAYILPSLKMCLGNDHGYLGSQPCNIDSMIESIENEDEDEDEDDELDGELN